MVAAPWPVFGGFDQAAFDGIAVYVHKFFDVLFVGKNVEVVVTGLPKLLVVSLRSLEVSALRTLRVVERGCCFGSERSR